MHLYGKKIHTNLGIAKCCKNNKNVVSCKKLKEKEKHGIN